MAATANDSSITNCAETITGFIGASQTAVDNGEGYDVEVNIAYIGKDLACNSSNILGITSSPNELHIIVDTFIKYKPSIDVDAGSSKWITYHRRTLQKL